uniref:Uncharacterized protein MANES_05G023700 n=1 Tax=Rhizophora mucronata TaxID=61149 RepID=A0A2P2JGK4_RHIMU
MLFKTLLARNPSSMEYCPSESLDFTEIQSSNLTNLLLFSSITRSTFMFF